MRPFSRQVVLCAYHRIYSSDLPKRCVRIFILSSESLMILMCARSIDTVVLWDWIISLPREWQYVNPFPPTHLYNSHCNISQIWKTSWTPVKVAYLFCRYVDSITSNATNLSIRRYWVITVVPYLLYAFVNNHTLETCQRIYKVNTTSDA